MGAISRLATPLFVKLAAVGGGLLLLVIAVLSWQLSSARGTIERQRNDLAACNAARAVQNAAIERQGQEQERTRQAFERAQREGNEAILAAQRNAGRLRQTPANGCPTPATIRNAPL